MSKSLISLLLGLFLAGSAWPQAETSGGDVEEPETTETAGIDDAADIDDAAGIDDAAESGETADIDDAAEIEEADEIVDPDFADAELDEQTYEEDLDDFVPSEEIPADEPIPFPSNI